MSMFQAPKYNVEEMERLRECKAVCRRAYSRMVADAVALGWREQEIALELADVADDYIVYLAAKPKQAILAANSNKTLVG
jgi:hypothetical protein